MTKQEAIEKFVETRLSSIPQEWVQIVAEKKDMYPRLPMWGTMWFIDGLWGKKLYDEARVMVGDKDEIDLDAIEDETTREEVKEAITALNEERISWGECALLEDYIEEEMAGERCILDKNGSTTPLYIYEIDGEYLIGVNGAGWNFYQGAWDRLYDAMELQWHDKEQK